MIEVKVEAFSDVVYEIMSLLSYHYAETEDTSKSFSPVVSMYNKLYQEDKFFIVVARDAGIPVGYYMATVFTSPHSQEKIMCTEEGFYVDRKYRGQGVAKSLFAEMEKECSNRGVTHIYTTIKASKPDNLVKGLGYVPEEVKYVKRIG